MYIHVCVCVCARVRACVGVCDRRETQNTTLEQLSLVDQYGKLTAIGSKCPKSDPFINLSRDANFANNGKKINTNCSLHSAMALL